MKKYLIPYLFILVVNHVSAQDLMPLITKAWTVSAELKAKDFQLANTVAAMKEAKAMYGPSVVFNTQYTLAAGGRTINFPVGDLLNPVYNTLNDLTNSNQFNLLENQNITFLPNNFYDAKLSVQQAIYHPDLALNRRMKSLESDLKLLEIKAYKRYLAREVMVTYFQGESAYQAMAIYEEADKVLAEARRATQSLLNNGLALPSAVQRIESQIATIRASAIETMHQKKMQMPIWSFLRAIHLTSVAPPLSSTPCRVDNRNHIPGRSPAIGYCQPNDRLRHRKRKQFLQA
ncbi:MAG: TolC family protein [Saprospiraceae bacterium]|nr:TolC family protein [Saprospiraceae bacterium]